MSDQSVSRLDASAVANVVSGVINALGLQPTLSSPHSSSDSNNTQNRRITRLVYHIHVRKARQCSFSFIVDALSLACCQTAFPHFVCGRFSLWGREKGLVT